MRILDLALKDLSQVLRDKTAALFLLIMPLVFTFFMGFAFRSAASTPDPRLPLGWINHDPGSLWSTSLHDLLAEAEALRLVELDPAQAAQAVKKVQFGEWAAALIVPEDASTRVQAGQPVQLTLVTDELSTIGQSMLQLVRAPLTRLMSAAETARLSLEWSRPSAPEDEWATSFSTAVEQWQQAARIGPQIVVEKAGADTSERRPLGGNPYNLSSPGILVQFAVAGLIPPATILVQERKTRTLQRLITTAMKRWQIIAGHLIAILVLAILQQALLIVFGQWVLGVAYFREPVSVLIVVVALGLWTSSLGLLIGVIAREEEQAILFSLLAMFVISGLGGAWFPLEGAGRAFRTIGHLTPGAWAMDGFQNILIRGLGLDSVLLPAGVLLAYAALFFGLAVWRFRADQPV